MRISLTKNICTTLFVLACDPSMLWAQPTQSKSSGGWGTLWLQISYPEEFGGVWSASPDYVDFRRFGHGINIYEPGTNMFYDRLGNPRPATRLQSENNPVYTVKHSSNKETILGDGGQFQSFEAVFGGRGPDGSPRRLYDRTTGVIDPSVALSWEKYDIRLLLERQWEMLEAKLKGKLHIYVASNDDYYLNEPLVLLKESLQKLGSDAEIVFFDEGGHNV